jgi:transposase
LINHASVRPGSRPSASLVSLTPRVRELVAASPALDAAIEPLLTAHATLRKSFTELHRQVLAVTRVDPVCRRLMTVPGVGAVTVLAYCSAVDIPERFSRSKAVGPHFGLVPRKYQSGATDRNGRITKAGDAMVRTAPPTSCSPGWHGGRP